VLFDGTCGFCKTWIARWRERTGDAVDYAPSQTEGARFPEIPDEVVLDTVLSGFRGGFLPFPAAVWQVRFVDECAGLQSMAGAFAAHQAMGDAMQFGVDGFD